MVRTEYHPPWPPSAAPPAAASADIAGRATEGAAAAGPAQEDHASTRMVKIISKKVQPESHALLDVDLGMINGEMAGGTLSRGASRLDLQHAGRVRRAA